MNSTATDKTSPDDFSKLGDLIKDIKFAMLTTIARDGQLTSRPMTTQNTNHFDGTLWFFAALNSPKTEDLEAHPEVNLAYAKPGSMEFVSVSGTAKISMDRAKMQELWSESYKAWFPEGLGDPNICLLRIEVAAAEYWDTPSAKVVQLFGYLKSKITGEKANPGEHRHVNVAQATTAKSANNAR
jgi:general stress protein 26